LDTEQEIERAVEEIMKDTGVSKLDALNMIFSRYESQKRLEEAVRVRRIIDKVETNAEGYENGMRQDT
jgi:hypothetical protein